MSNENSFESGDTRGRGGKRRARGVARFMRQVLEREEKLRLGKYVQGKERIIDNCGDDKDPFSKEDPLYRPPMRPVPR